MGVGTVVDHRGVVMNNNSSGLAVNTSLNANGSLTVASNANNSGFSPYKVDGAASLTSPKAGSFTITVPGFYWVSGSTLTTGSLPAADTMPGAFLTFNQTLAGRYGFMLTGSARSTNATSVFTVNGVVSSSLDGAASAGDKLTVATSGSVALVSDGLRWVPFASSGSLTVAA